MDCSLIRPDLVSFHFGTLEGPARDALERHLEGCQECLRDFLALKRAFEVSAERPSAAARARLRGAVRAELASRAGWRWWERPLAMAFAAAVLVATVSGVQALARGEGAAPRGVSAGR